MEKEQITIDGVDVSGCEFHQIDANELYPKAHYCGSMKNTFCENDPNCYYKQLVRKTQECEKLKEQLMQKDEVNTFFNTPIEGWSDDPCEICPCKNELQLAEQLIAGILKTLNLEAYDWRADQNEIITEIKAFKQECEELKEYARRQENQRETYYKEFIKKDKALEEIKEIADVLITETNEYESCYYKDSCGDNCFPRVASQHSRSRQTYCQYEAVAKILDIINKAKEGNNENT